MSFSVCVFLVFVVVVLWMTASGLALARWSLGRINAELESASKREGG